MKEIRIFLASSYELEPDRIRFGDLIRRLNDEYMAKGIHLALIKWEDLPAFYAEEGQQKNYDRNIRQSQIFVALFWHRAGRHTVDEFNVAKNAPGVTPYVLCRAEGSELPPLEYSLVKRYWDEHTSEEIAVEQEKRELFLSGIKEYSSPQKYSTFAGLEKDFRKFLTKWLSENTGDLPAWRETYQSAQIIALAEEALAFDRACIGDMVRSLNQKNWNGVQYRFSDEISNGPEQNPFMLCLNCHSIPPAEEEQINRFLDGHQTDGESQLLLMQRKSDRAETLNDWYRSHKQYSVGYSSTDGLLRIFLQHLLIHEHQDTSALKLRDGVLYLKSSHQNAFAVMDLKGCEAVKTIVEELRRHEANVKNLQEEADNHANDDALEAELGNAKNLREECLTRLNAALGEFFTCEQAILKSRRKIKKEQYRQLTELCRTGKFDALNDRLKELLPSEEKIGSLINECQALKREQDRLDELLYQNRRDNVAISNSRAAIENRREANHDEIKEAIGFECLEAQAIANKSPETAIACYEKADSLYETAAPNDANRIWDVWKPLGELYQACGRPAEAAALYEKCICLLDKLPERPGDVYFELCLSCADCYHKCWDKHTCEKAIHYAEKLIDSRQIGYASPAYYIIGEVQMTLHDLKAARAAFDMALSSACNMYQKLLAQTSSALLYLEERNDDEAWDNLIPTEEYFDRLLNNNAAGLCPRSAAVAGSKFEKTVLLSGKFATAFAELDECTQQLGLFFFSTAQSVMSHHFGEYGKIVRITDSLLKLEPVISPEFLHLLVRSFVHKGAALIGLRNEQKALEILTRAKDIVERGEVQDPLEANVYRFMGAALNGLGKSREALEILTRAKDIIAQSEIPPFAEELWSIDQEISRANIGLTLQNSNKMHDHFVLCSQTLKIETPIDSTRRIYQVAPKTIPISKTETLLDNTRSTYSNSCRDDWSMVITVNNVCGTYENLVSMPQTAVDNDWRAELDACKKALETTDDPRMIAGLHYRIGELHQELGAPQVVINADRRAESDALSKALETARDPLVLADLYQKLGETHEYLGKPQEALDAYERAVETARDPRTISVLYYRIGELHQELGAPQDMIDANLRAELDAYEKALKITDDPYEIADLHQKIGAVHQELGAPQDVIDNDLRAELGAWSKALETADDPYEIADLHQKIGALHQELGAPQDVIDTDLRAELDAHKQALETANDPYEIADLHQKIGALHQKIGAPQDVIDADRLAESDALSKALETARDPLVLADLYQKLGETHEDLGKPQETLDAYERAVETARDPRTISVLYYRIGELHQELGAPQDVIDNDRRAELDAYEKTLEIADDSYEIAELYRKIGDVHEELGAPQAVIDANKRAEAVACRKALEIENAPAQRMELHRRLGALHRELREPEEALAAYDAAIEIIAEQNDTSAMAGTIYNEAGHISGELGDLARALRDCREALQILRLHLDEKDPVIVKTEEFIREIREKTDEDTAHQ